MSIVQELQDVAASRVGSGGIMSVNRRHLAFLKTEGHELRGEGIGNGGKNVMCTDFVDAVRKLRAADPLEEEVTAVSELDRFDFLSEQAKNSLQAEGLTTLAHIHDYVNADNDLTTLKGIGDATARQLMEQS